jgi:hypothetical protein
LVRSSQRKRLLGKSGCKWEHSIAMVVAYETEN